MDEESQDSQPTENINQATDEQRPVMAQYGRMHEYDDSKEDFGLYLERLEQYFVANKIADETKVPVFLTLIGPNAYALLRNLLQPTIPKVVSYQELCETLEKHYQPKRIIIAERYKFYKRNQMKGELTSTYIVELKKLAATCAFQTFLDEALRDRLVCGLYDESTQKRLIAKDNITFKEAAELAMMFETANKNSIEIHEPRLNVHLVGSKPQEGKRYEQKSTYVHRKVKCYRCDGEHYANDCKHKQTKCNNCKKVGHLAKACKTKNVRQKPNVRMVVEEDRRSHSPEESLRIYSVTDNAKNADDYVVPVTIKGKNLSMILDTAADLSTVNEDWCKINLPHVKLNQSKVRLSDYNDTHVKILGNIKMNVVYAGQEAVVCLHVVEGSKPSLFGKDMIKTFKIDILKVLNVICDEMKPSISTESWSRAYRSLFEGNSGPIKHYKAAIKLMENSNPVFFKARNVPFALKSIVEKEIMRMKNSGIWEETNHSEWATPLVIVPKTDNTVRLCGDFKVTVNKVMHVDQHPLPTQKELFAMMNGAKYFTKLDMKNAYQQIELEKNAQEILTINTHLGLFKPKRLLYGVANASAVFQNVMDRMLGGLTNVMAYQDDILVIGKNKMEHDSSLNLVLRRLQEYNVQLNINKCKLAQTSIQYLGHIVDEKGIHPTDEKISDIKNAKIPQNVEELQMFLGLFNYYIRFIKDSATLLEPLHELLKKDKPWKWSIECQRALDECKKRLTSNDVLIHYDENKPLVLECDASPVGVGAILSHVLPDSSCKPIAYASRKLSSPEKNYAQVEREALAVVFGLKKFEQYLYGRKFVIITDHKPLLSIFSPTKPTNVLAAGRLQRWSIILGSYNYVIQYRKGSKHTNVDTLSRLPVEDTFDIENKVFKISYVHDLPVSSKDIENATSMDKTLSKVLHKVRFGWEKEISDDIKPYHSKREQLSTQDGCILWGYRVIIPQKYRPYILELLHDSHPGIVKMKGVARSHVWWPGIDNEIEQLVNNCVPCRHQMNMPPSVPLQSWIWPRGPWERVHIDFAQKGQNYFLVIVDSHSKWLEVTRMRNITTKSTVEVLREMISRYGFPKELVSDNGPQLISEDFEEFLKKNGIIHTLIPIYSPKCNGAAERCVQHFKSALAKMDDDKRDNTTLDHKIARFLLMQRSSPHSTTNKTPSELFLKRELRTKLSLIHSSTEDLVSSKQLKQKKIYDRTHGAEKQIDEGQEIFYRDYTSSHEKWRTGTVTNKMGTNTWNIQTENGNKLVHSDQVRNGNPVNNIFKENDQTKINSDCNAGDMDNKELVGSRDQEFAGLDVNVNSGETVVIPKEMKPNLRRSTRVPKRVVKMNL